MHKSILFLLGLLTFLIPVGPSMSNSNVLAFEDYRYEANQYEQYANDKVNDNYYKSQGSDFIKKIRCNNINSNINGDNNSISFGSGKGVGAESIQDDASVDTYGYDKRSNSNFDINCISTNNNIRNNTADQDSPSTFQLIEGTNVYRVTNSTNIEGESEVLRVECEPGDFVLNGGYDLNNFNPDVTTVVRDTPIISPEGGGWEVNVFGIELTIITVHAYCFDNSPSSTLAASSVLSSVQQSAEDSPIISQGIQDLPKSLELDKQSSDSVELTTTEKIDKLKTQWLESLR